MKSSSFRLLLLALVVLIACSTPTDPKLAAATPPEGLFTQRSGLWATKVFATFPTFIDEAPSSQPGTVLTPDQSKLQPIEGVTPNSILSDCATMVFHQDGSVKTTSFEPCPSPEQNPLGFLWWMLQGLWRN